MDLSEMKCLYPMVRIDLWTVAVSLLDRFGRPRDGTCQVVAVMHMTATKWFICGDMVCVWLGCRHRVLDDAMETDGLENVHEDTGSCD